MKKTKKSNRLLTLRTACTLLEPDSQEIVYIPFQLIGVELESPLINIPKFSNKSVRETVSGQLDAEGTLSAASVSTEDSPFFQNYDMDEE